jgi:hypothetical protein
MILFSSFCDSPVGALHLRAYSIDPGSVREKKMRATSVREANSPTLPGFVCCRITCYPRFFAASLSVIRVTLFIHGCSGDVRP